MAKIMDGNILAGEIKDRVIKGVEAFRQQGIEVGLGLMLVGEDPASKQYLKATLRTCKKAGIRSYEYNLPEDTSINEVINKVNEINADERISGLLTLLPMPKNINSRIVSNHIVPEKDVDGLGSLSVGRLAADESTFQIFRKGLYDSLYLRENPSAVSSFLPCTPFGVIRLIEHYGIEIKGRHAVVIGKSIAVGKPLSMMLLAKEATVTICHKETRDLAHFTGQADIICSATGVKGLITGDMIKEGAVVVDIGINVLDDGSITGDIELKSVAEKASYVTPVPGGVGPVTIAMLLENTVRSAQNSKFFEQPLSGM